MMLCTKHCASRIEFARRITTYSALGQAGRPSPSPDTLGRSTLRSLSEATNYDQPRACTLLGVLFCGGPLQLLLLRKPETFMTVACPICKSSAQELLHTGDAAAFHCPTHGDFKVADTVFAEANAKGYTREQWEAALDKAEERAEPDEWL